VAADGRADEREASKLSADAHSDTIFALSSGSPPAAVALVRISGPRADFALEALVGKLPQPRYATLAELRWKSERLDQALLLRFPGPHSVTGEDVVELHLHGGRAVVAGVLDALAAIEGLRPALPGEFTRRAFESGRIDLIEAEGLADLLEAETEAQRRNALALAGGTLSRQVEAWRERLLALSAQVEAVLDFSGEEDAALPPLDFAEGMDSLRQEIETWLRRPTASRLKDGIRVVVAGPPNAGKSSLFNVLVGREAAITSSIPGTTRDVIEAPVAIGGMPFLLIDTAGLREADEEVEAMGVDRARRSAAAADLLLWLGPPEEAPQQAIRVHPKADLGPPSAKVDVAISARERTGIEELIRIMIRDSANLLPAERDIALHERHHQALAEMAEALGEGTSHQDLLLVAEALRRCRKILDRVTGRAGVEDMLDSLFGRFCIGK
jgi:tRNA modification GTPase